MLQILQTMFIYGIYEIVLPLIHAPILFEAQRTISNPRSHHCQRAFGTCRSAKSRDVSMSSRKKQCLKCLSPEGSVAISFRASVLQFHNFGSRLWFWVETKPSQHWPHRPQRSLPNVCSSSDFPLWRVPFRPSTREGRFWRSPHPSMDCGLRRCEDIILLSDPLPMHDFHEQPPVWHGPRYVCPVGLGHPSCILARNVWVWILVFSAVQLKPIPQNSITRYDSEAL